MPIRQQDGQRGRAGPDEYQGAARPGGRGRLRDLTGRGLRGLTGRKGRENAAGQWVTPHGGQPAPPYRRWLARRSVRLAGIATLVALTAFTAGQASAGLPAGEPFTGLPPVGALFTTEGAQLGSHFCTASVVNSPDGDLLITAAHCLASVQGTVAFVPGYTDGSAPYGVWDVTQVFTDQAWASSSDPDDDVAFLKVNQGSAGVPIQNVTGAEGLSVGQSPSELVQVVGYLDGADQPIICQNWTRPAGSGQMEFDCGGYGDGTSGGPFLAHVNQVSGQGMVIGVIGGYLQGGDTPSQSYSITFGRGVSTLYQDAIAGS